jgi:hypothetical protein
MLPVRKPRRMLDRDAGFDLAYPGWSASLRCLPLSGTPPFPPTRDERLFATKTRGAKDLFPNGNKFVERKV